MTKFDKVLRELSLLRDFHRKLAQAYKLPKDNRNTGKKGTDKKS